MRGENSRERMNMNTDEYGASLWSMWLEKILGSTAQ